jgi:hypothetical protein
VCWYFRAFVDRGEVNGKCDARAGVGVGVCRSVVLVGIAVDVIFKVTLNLEAVKTYNSIPVMSNA